MWDTITNKVHSYWTYYLTELQYQWHHMTPMKYGMLLIFIFAVGFLLLRSSIQRT